mmetsp:Transcript_24955/g.70271  ORF Transcript_24955/g.70271 Transcript_24955/m.70271 type:complete len:529 (-) Transcript_24955:455-2041(-)
MPPALGYGADLDGGALVKAHLVVSAVLVRPQGGCTHRPLLEVLVLRDLLPLRAEGARILDAAGGVHEILDAHPELPVIEPTVADGLLHLVGPLAEGVLVGPLPGPLARAPGVPAADQVVAERGRALQHGVHVAADEARREHGLAALPRALLGRFCHDEGRGQEPAVLASVLQGVEVVHRVLLVLRLDQELTAHAPEEAEDRLVRAAAVAHLVAVVELAVRLLEDRAPHLLGVVGPRVEEAAIRVHRHQVVHDDVGPLAVQAEPHAVHADLRVVLDEHPPDTVLLVAGDGAHGAQQEAGADLPLHNVAGVDPALEEHRVLGELCHALECRRLGHGAIVPLCHLVDIEAQLRCFIQIPLGVGEFRAIGPALGNDGVDRRGAAFAVPRRPGIRGQQGRIHHAVLHSVDELGLRELAERGLAGLRQEHLALVHRLQGVLRRPLRRVELMDYSVERCGQRHAGGFLHRRLLRVLLHILHSLDEEDEFLAVLGLDLQLVHELHKRDPLLGVVPILLRLLNRAAIHCDCFVFVLA